ncbi:zinc transporter ZIP10-like isoform X1 [Argopecten irradians]|uniref:zinc transporter ZIP10-like isoform X1 n=1 Tax=Argopecten irradians TaxID=31199 RepID=UPI0037134A40
MAHRIVTVLSSLLFISSKVSAASSPKPDTPELTTLDSVSTTTADNVLDYIFEKYSSDYIMPFEGYEHLLESLRLGVIQLDHSVEIHLSNSSEKFVQFHDDHDHPLRIDDHTGHEHSHPGEHSHSHVHVHRRKFHGHNDGTDHKHDGDHDHSTNEDNQHKHEHDHDNTHDHVTNDEHGETHDQVAGDKLTNEYYHIHDHEHKHHFKQEKTVDNNNNHKHSVENDSTRNISNNKHTTEHVSKEYDYAHDHLVKRNAGHERARSVPDELLSKCLKPMDLLRLLRFTDQGLTKTQFKELCPLLIVQLDQHHCDDMLYRSPTHSDIRERREKSSVKSETWLYACGAIVVISVAGLFCVGILSLLHHMFVENFLHFLVAMAVGALTGDAMLHLLPHALSSSEDHSHGTSDSHDLSSVYKGLAALSVFYFFFLFGRIQNIASNKKVKKELDAEEVDPVNMTMVIRSPDAENNMILERVVTNRSIEMDTTKAQRGHSHGHSHDDPPGSTGAMLWRVIVGDGIHNLSDGLAIGVAFAVSVTTGLSTSIAVLCHELPHEIGDFAVLLKKGMSIKQALGFNCLSSILSMIGALAGVAMGNITGIKEYILVCVAGMFIYISLVDMIPEISSNPPENPLRHLIFTMLGICLGSGIMLTIALKENELKQLLVTT